jgi:hypothetical protein
VRHIPDMHLNLIFISVLDKEGYESHLGNGKWKLFKGLLVFARGKICCTLYKTQVKLCRDVVNAAQDDFTPDLWHRRLAHMSEKGLQILAKKSLIPFAKGMPLNSCDYCLFGKQHRVSFHKSSTRKSKCVRFGLFLMYVVPLRWNPLVVIDILLHLLMMFQERCRCMFSKQKTRYFSSSRNSMPWWKERKGSL